MSENQNPETCNHNCESCYANCSSRGQASFKIEANPRSTIRHMIGVVSGKGGVGKSFITSLLASEMQRRGYRAAVLDGDITGPSQAKAFGVHEKATGDGTVIYPAVTERGMQVMSTNMLLDSDDTPVIWRGPMVANILKQFYTDVFWDNVDYMFVDMPPGTSDVPLTAFQSLPLDGIVVVTTPQELVGMVVDKAINMANAMNIKVLGIVENMSYVECPNCGEKIYVFGESHVAETAEKYGLDVLARVPLDGRIAKMSDEGTIEELKVTALDPAADVIEKL